MWIDEKSLYGFTTECSVSTLLCLGIAHGVYDGLLHDKLHLVLLVGSLRIRASWEPLILQSPFCLVSPSHSVRETVR